jgi:prolyl oligopeptidase
MDFFRRLATLRLAACLWLLAFSVLYAAQDTPPKTPVRDAADTYFGTKIVDPYRWMEDLKSPEMVAWMKAQSEHTRRYLDGLPIRDAFLKRVNELSNANVAVSGVQRAAGKHFYYKLAPGENTRKLYVRDGLNGAERLLLDPDKLSTKGTHYSIDTFSLSQDGQYVSYTISSGGSEMGELHVLDVSTGRELGERIDRARFDAGAWLPDGRSFLYNRLQKLLPGAPATDLYQKSRVYRHVLGADPEKDQPVFGYDVNPEITFEPTLLPFAYPVPGSTHVIALVNSGVSPNSAFYIAPVASLALPTIPWRKIADFTDEVSNIDLHGDDVYVLTYRQTPRFKVVRTSLAHPDLATAQPVIPASEAVVTAIAAANDALYVQTLDGGIGRLWRVDFSGGAPQQVKLPYDGSVSIVNNDQRLPGVLFTTTSWTKAPTIFAYDAAQRRVVDTKLQPPSPVDFSSIESVEVKAKSHDGVMIPLSIIYKRGLKRDGSNPTLLDGYGAYGISRDPAFSPVSLAWLERGGVLAVAHVRGGGEYGEEWHLAGYKQTKPNTWKDFIACAEYLVREKYTSPQYLGGQGGSAGGILMSNTIAERPDLLGAAIIYVGVNNTLRAETTSNGVPNIPEFGTFTTEEGFKALLAMDGYHKVRNGTAYPAVLLTTGINDPRVEPWMSAKMAARLQAATTSGKPVLLRVDYDAGHGMGSTRQQRNEERADVYTFLQRQLAPGKTKSSSVVAAK